jgi:hypothetical protein
MTFGDHLVSVQGFSLLDVGLGFMFNFLVITSLRVRLPASGHIQKQETDLRGRFRNWLPKDPHPMDGQRPDQIFGSSPPRLI